MTNLWLLAVPVLLLISCSSDEPSKMARKEHTEKRQATAEAALSKTPAPRTYSLQGNQLQVIEVPVADNSGFVDSNRCYVWRDLEFKTTSISCESRPDVTLSHTN